MINYNVSNKEFEIRDNNNEVLATVPFPFSHFNKQKKVFDEADANKYNFYIYYKKDVKELDYYQVYVKEKDRIRIGWIIPITTLTTDDDDILKEEFLNEFAFGAYCHLLENTDIRDELYEGVFWGDVLNNKYPDGNLLIIERALMPDGKTEKNYELSLARLGYYKNSIEYINPKINLQSDKNLVLKPAIEILEPDGKNYRYDYIEEFLKDKVYNKNSFIRFFFLYQIVEVLIDAELVGLLKDLIEKIKSNQTSYRKADSLLKEDSELSRFRKVAENAGIKPSNYVDLDNLCNKFLVSDKTLKCPDSIYQVRNHIVHRFRKAIADEVAVKEICDYMELYLYDVLINYKLPDVNNI